MPVPQDPTITIRFTGLLVFCFDKKLKYCQIGVHSKTDDHELRLRFVKKRLDPKSQSEQVMIISHGLIRQASDLWLGIEGEPSTMQPAAEPFVVGGQDEPPTDPQDFRRVVDLEGEHFYNRPLKVKRDVLKPILGIATGLFYTATLTSDSYRTVTRATKAIVASRSLGQIAEYIGANIYISHPNQALVLRAGRIGPELLRLEIEDGVTYEITVENVDTPQAPDGSDFYYYYDALQLNRGEPRILIETYGLPSAGLGKFPPCGPIVLSKSDGLVFE